MKQNSRDQHFLEELRQLVLDNLTNEQFSVEQLADTHGTSRSYLHKRLKKLEQKSVSQFIREIRLKEAMKMLQQDLATASEIAYRVGSSSPTYFNTCFKDYFGCPPGEVKFRLPAEEKEISDLRDSEYTISPEARDGRTAVGKKGVREKDLFNARFRCCPGDCDYSVHCFQDRRPINAKPVRGPLYCYVHCRAAV
ncbi:MAG TPA: AraC family transcriptional regulator [Eudoraea sp.]|nr:AraC family transcriptional regulator [Eudoraea sp.]